MVMGMQSNGAVRITDTKTGISAIVDVGTQTTRSERQAKDKAMKLLRSRIWAQQNGFNRPESVIADYDLPDENPFPNDLAEYRQDQSGA